MPATKVGRIKDEGLRESMAAAHASLRSGDYLDVVRRSADAYLELLRRKPELLEGTEDEINARWQQEDSALSLDEARERAQRAFDRRIEAIEAVPADRWDAVTEACARADGAQHYRAHRSFIVVA